VAYHGVTRPTIDAGRHALKRAITHFRNVQKVRKGTVGRGGIDLERRSRILKKTRGLTADNGRLWSKNTMAGLKRRQAAAAKIKFERANAAKARIASKPPSRPVQASVAQTRPQSPVAQKITRKAPPKSIQEAIAGSKTHGQLKRKLTGLAIRRISMRGVAAGSSRKEMANKLRAHRQYAGKGLKDRVKEVKGKYFKAAASNLANRKKS